MKLFKYFLILTIAILGVSAVDVNAQSAQNLEQKVFKQLIKMPYYGVFDHISYKVDGSTVTLYGKVISLGLKKDAERTVSRIDGVNNVVNNIEYLPPSPFDDRIRVQIVRTFASRGGSLYRYLQEPNPSMRIIVNGGRVTLEGYVANRSDANLANILANGVTGVFNVQNNLIVEKDRAR